MHTRQPRAHWYRHGGRRLGRHRRGLCVVARSLRQVNTLPCSCCESHLLASSPITYLYTSVRTGRDRDFGRRIVLSTLFALASREAVG